MLERITATIILTILFPFFALISVSIYIFSGRPILFKHKRCGYKFDEFYVIKFRTMRPNKGPSLTGFQDQRITGIGKILRKLKLDELPQLANIIKGEMVFIGPRPESIDIVNNHKNYFTYLDTIKPGITDINSIIFKDESDLFKTIDTKKYVDEILPIKYRLALFTSDNQNIFHKIILFLLSILAVIYHKLSLRIVSRFFLPYDEQKFRIKLNNLLSEQIF